MPIISVKLKLRKPIVLKGLNEDDIRQLLDAIELDLSGDDTLGFPVESTGGIEVKFVFGQDGNFSGVYAPVLGQEIPIIPGLRSSNAQIFLGAPSPTNPGVGWKVEIDLTKRYFNQPENPVSWELFLASREAVINSFS